MKAHSVALFPSSRPPAGGSNSNRSGLLLTDWKHSSPFQNVSVIIPSPPTSLNMKEVRFGVYEYIQGMPMIT